MQQIKINFVGIFCLLLIGDLISKQLIRLTGGFFVCNPGFAFGLKVPFLDLLRLVLLISCGYLLFFTPFKKTFFQKNPLIKGFLSFIFAGGSANLLEKSFHYCVTDFIKLPMFNFPLFNFADIFLTIGVTGLIFSLLTHPFSVDKM